jgi:hypothetical protein
MVVQSLVDLFSNCLCNCDSVKFFFFNKPVHPLQPDLENICIAEVKQHDDVGNWEYVDRKNE